MNKQRSISNLDHDSYDDKLTPARGMSKGDSSRVTFKYHWICLSKARSSQH